MWARAYPLSIDAERLRRAAESPEVAEAEREVLRAPPQAPDHPRRPRRPLQERAARLHRLRHLPHPAPRVPRGGHLHRPPAAVAAGRARVRRVPGADRGAGRGRQPPPRHHRLDADRPQDLRELPRGGRPLQALRPADGQLDVRRHEPGRQGGAGGQHPRRGLDALREHRLPRGAGRLRALGQPVRHPGAGRHDLPGADHEHRGAAAAGGPG